MKKKVLFVAILLSLVLSGGLLHAAPSSSSDPIEFENPLGVDSIEGLLGKVMDNINSVLITIAIIMLLIGGIMYMLSFGNDQSMERAKKVILAAIIGLSIALSAKTFLQTLWDVLGVNSSTAGSPGGESFEVVAGRILTFLLSIVGIIAIISLIIGGIMYMTAYGDEDRIQKGKKIVIASIIGIVISVGSVVIVKQIGDWLGYSF